MRQFTSLTAWADSFDVLWGRFWSLHLSELCVLNGDSYASLGDEVAELIGCLDGFIGHSEKLDVMVRDITFRFKQNEVWPKPERLDHLRTLEPEQDGPVSPNAWRHEGRVYEGMQTNGFQLALFIWKQPGRACLREALELIWPPPSLGPEGARSTANRFFRDHEIELRVRVTKEFATLTPTISRIIKRQSV